METSAKNSSLKGIKGWLIICIAVEVLDAVSLLGSSLVLIGQYGELEPVNYVHLIVGGYGSVVGLLLCSKTRNAHRQAIAYFFLRILMYLLIFQMVSLPQDRVLVLIKVLWFGFWICYLFTSKRVQATYCPSGSESIDEKPVSGTESQAIPIVQASAAQGKATPSNGKSKWPMSIGSFILMILTISLFQAYQSYKRENVQLPPREPIHFNQPMNRYSFQQVKVYHENAMKNNPERFSRMTISEFSRLMNRRYNTDAFSEGIIDGRLR